MKRAEKQRQRIDDEIDRRRSKRRRDDDEYKVVEGVIDPPTLKAIYRLFKRTPLDKVHGVISTGKEANVYRGETTEGKSVAVKVYRMSTAETDFMKEYMIGDPRFKRVGRRSRVLIPQWAMKEYKNLIRYHEAGVRVPVAIAIDRNVLVMEFIGSQEESLAAPAIKDIVIPSPVKTYNEIMQMIELGYTKAKLVHADLSEYNILWMDGPIIIDVSQAVVKDHDNATKYLYRDIQNVTFFFNKLGVDTPDPEEITSQMISLGEESNDVS
ncbi:MAG: serine protein kinase RIO [Candidatus Thorarchaeota archaeon]